MVGFTAPYHLLVGVMIAIWLPSPSTAQTDDNSRGVRIIEEVPGGSAPAVPAPSPQPPSLPPASLPATTLHAPAPDLPAPAPSAPALPAPAPSAPALPALAPSAPAALPAPAPSLQLDAVVAPTTPFRPEPGQAALAPAARPDVGAMQALLKTRNSAGVVVEVLPQTELRVGEKIALRVATKKQGYLVIVDVDASGKLTQIYPNRRSLLVAQEGQESANLIKPGRPITVPEIGNPYAGFEFVVAPPTGLAMVVAILSDRPVQMLDLPDIPASIVGPGAAIDYLTEWTRNLRIARADSAGALEEANWSFDAKLYAIR